MRKIKKILICALAFVMSLVSMCFVLPKQTAFADSTQDETTKNQIVLELEKFIEYNSIFEKTRASRTPGSKAEYESAMYLKEQMSLLSNFKPVNNASTTNGIQRFEFISIYDSMTYTSQNVIFERKSASGTGKKIVIGAHYDTSAYTRYIQNQGDDQEQIEVQDGINDNAASVATLIQIVRTLDGIVADPGFDIEIVFFGASNNEYAGSKHYMKGIDDKSASNILAMINLDKIGLGNYNYFYVDEYENSQKRYLKGVLSDEFNIRALRTTKALHFSKESPNGLNYTHIGLESDHAVFMKRNINVVNFFSGYYENNITFGMNEYEGYKTITYTTNDNYEFVKENFPDFANNMVNVYNAVCDLIYRADFVSEMEKPNGSEDFYSFYQNEKLAVFITVILFVVFTFGFYLIYLHLQKKSKQKIQENELDKIIIKIAKNIGEDADDFVDFIDKKIKGDAGEEDQGQDENNNKDDKKDDNNKN